LIVAGELGATKDFPVVPPAAPGGAADSGRRTDRRQSLQNLKHDRDRCAHIRQGIERTSIALGDGALHLTTALYFTPLGRSIQARGIDLDIEIRKPFRGDDLPAESLG
jgi:hypothetical protein